MLVTCPRCGHPFVATAPVSPCPRCAMPVAAQGPVDARSTLAVDPSEVARVAGAPPPQPQPQPAWPATRVGSAPQPWAPPTVPSAPPLGAAPYATPSYGPPSYGPRAHYAPPVAALEVDHVGRAMVSVVTGVVAFVGAFNLVGLAAVFVSVGAYLAADRGDVDAAARVASARAWAFSALALTGLAWAVAVAWVVAGA